jgi:ParB family chromosome partitioning protein
MAKSSVAAYGAEGEFKGLLLDPEKITIIGLDTKDGPEHPLYDERINLPLDEGMIKQIMRRGIKTPVVVTKDPESGAVLLKAGRQRVRNAREANKRLRKAGEEPIWVPATTERGFSDEASLMETMMIENSFRQDDTPVVRAKKIQRYLERGRSEEQAAELLGLSVATIKNLLGLLEAPAAVRNAVDNGKITATEGYQLAKLQPEEAKTKLAVLTANGAALTKKGRRKRGEGKKSKKILSRDGKVARSKQELKEMLKIVETHDSMKEAHRMGALPFLKWALGAHERVLWDVIDKEALPSHQSDDEANAE